MYLTAQRVRAVHGAEEGINSFRHRHSSTWAGAPPAEIPDEDPGELVARHAPVKPGGNRVRSYLDIIAPENATWPTIRQSFLEFVGEISAAPFPWAMTLGSMRFVVGMDPDLAQRWQNELAALFAAAQRLATTGGS
jgi:hypothetical protein